MQSVIMRSVIMLSVTILIVVMLSVVMLSVVMLSVVMLRFILMIVVAPFHHVNLLHNKLVCLLFVFRHLSPWRARAEHNGQA